MLIILNIVIALSSVCAQSSVKLLGGVIDSVNNVPLEYVTISFCKSTIGTSSNKDGKFALIVDPTHADDSIYFSRIGYEKKTIAVSEFVRADSSTLFALKPVLTEIEQVNVPHRTIPEMLKLAIETTNARISPNSILDVYYREFAYLDNELFKFSDAAIYFEVKSEDKKSKVETYVAESRIIKDSITTDQKWKSDVESLIDTDKAAKLFYNVNYLMKFVEKNNEVNYDFLLDGDEDIMKIQIRPKLAVKKYLPSVLVYVDRLSNQILRADYGYDSHLKYMPSINLMILKYAVKKDWAINIYATGDRVFLRYSKVIQDIDFKVGKKKGILGSHVEVLVSHAGVDANSLNGLSPSKKTAISQNGNNYTTSFWEERIAILPTPEDALEITKLAL